MNDKRSTVAMICALVGAVLLSLILAAPLVLGLFFIKAMHAYMVDWFLPAEVFPITLAAVAFVFASSFIAKTRRALVVTAGSVAVFGLIVSQVVALLAGLANGEAPQNGWQMVLTMSLFALFWIGLLGLAVAGFVIVRDCARRLKGL